MTFNIALKPIQFGAADGDRFEVFPVIENPTNDVQTDTVELSVNGVVRNSRTFQLSAGDEKRVTLVWDVSIEENNVWPVTVSTGSDSASDEATFRVFDDTIRIRFDSKTRSGDTSHEETFVEDETKTGAGAE